MPAPPPPDTSTSMTNPRAAPAPPAPTPSYHRSEHAATYRSKANFVYSSKNTSAVLQLLDAQPGEKILDIGCGSGELTRVIASQVGAKGEVLGLDLSTDMLEAARAATTSEDDSAPITYDEADGCHLPAYLISHPHLISHFDKIFSNAALHWMKSSPLSVIQGAHRSLKPSGTFVGECGGFMNMIGVRGALHHIVRTYAPGVDPTSVDPWYFPTPEAYTALLTTQDEETGLPLFNVESCELVPRPTPLPSGLTGWIETFGGPFLNALPDEEARRGAMRDLEEMLRPDMYDEVAGGWTAMYVRLRFKATKVSPSASSTTTAAATASTQPLAPPTPQTKKLHPDSSSHLASQQIQSRFINRVVLVHMRPTPTPSAPSSSSTGDDQQRVFKGTFKCVDDAGNVVLQETDEWTVRGSGEDEATMAAAAGLETETEDRIVSRRFVGMVMIRGEDVGRVEVLEDDERGDGGGAGGGRGGGMGMGMGWPEDPNAYA